MALLKLPKSFDHYLGLPGRKPVGPVEIDKTNDITKKIGRGDVWGPFNQNMRGLSNGVELSLVGGTSYQASSKGIGIVGTLSTSDGAEISSSEFTTHGWGGLTFLTVCYMDGSTSASQLMRETDVSGRGIDVEFVTSSTIRCLIETTGTTIWTAGKDATINTAAGWYVVGMTWDGANRKIWQIPLGGTASYLRSDACTGTINITTASGFKKFVIQGGQNTGSVGYDQPQVFNILLDKGLTDAQVNSFARDPYQILKPANDLLYFTPSAAGSTYTLTADVTAYTLGGDSVNLLYKPVLTADVTAYTLGGDSVNLTYSPVGSYTLTADPASFTLGGDGVNLLYKPVLTADVTSYVLGGDSVNLTYNPVGSYTLNADVTAYTLGGDSVNLTYARIFTADVTSYTLTFAEATLTLGLLDTPNCYTWLVSDIVSYEYLMSDINDAATYLISGIDDSVEYLTSNINGDDLYLIGDLCS